MKGVWHAAVSLGFLSLVAAIISRFTMRPLAIAPGGGLQAEVLLNFANTCFLVAITFILLGQKK